MSHIAAIVLAAALVPAPREFEAKEGVCRSDAPVVAVHDASIPPEGYRLSVEPGAIKIASSDAAGEFYARETLKQLARVRHAGESLLVRPVRRHSGGFAIAHSWRPVQQLERIHLERVRPRLEDVASHLRHGRGSLDFQAPFRLCRFQAPHGSPPQTAYFQRRQLRTAGMISRSRRKAKGFE